jgi:hypothetical protein
MSSLASSFLGMTLLYFINITISYKVVLVYMDDLFMFSSLVHHLEAHVLDEQGLSIQLTSDLLMFLMFVHELEARVLREHDPLILLNRHKKAQICLCTHPSLIQLDSMFVLYEVCA